MESINRVPLDAAFCPAPRFQIQSLLCHRGAHLEGPCLLIISLPFLALSTTACSNVLNEMRCLSRSPPQPTLLPPRPSPLTLSPSPSLLLLLATAGNQAAERPSLLHSLCSPSPQLHTLALITAALPTATLAPPTNKRLHTSTSHTHARCSFTPAFLLSLPPTLFLSMPQSLFFSPTAYQFLTIHLFLFVSCLLFQPHFSILLSIPPSSLSPPLSPSSFFFLLSLCSTPS